MKRSSSFPPLGWAGGHSTPSLMHNDGMECNVGRKEQPACDADKSTDDGAREGGYIMKMVHKGTQGTLAMA